VLGPHCWYGTKNKIRSMGKYLKPHLLQTKTGITDLFSNSKLYLHKLTNYYESTICSIIRDRSSLHNTISKKNIIRKGTCQTNN